MNLPKAIFFDLDDTILALSNASLLAWEKCCDEFISKNHVPFSSKELLKAVTETREWYWSDPVRNKKGREDINNAYREVFRYTLKNFDFDEEKSILETADRYNFLQESLWSLFDGLPSAFEILKAMSIRMAVITNGKAEIQRRKLERFHINHYFEKIIIDSEVGVSKPDVSIYRMALSALSLSSQYVWMIGDNLAWDVQAPQSIGIFSVWNDFTNIGLPVNSQITPDLIVGSVREMVKNIENIR